mmetsp:Transcript_1837/g.2587  ORF Transcript_1837/g.2587 Transcript_1837/m.2587 type:complete len:707 (+) Transcript_1837:60-2180(+)|eukprot:CAMPEP_0196579422 /NCGR_PEP_ID=MMETSP1081-20130531/21918_1 /TAXON_ID=36882 /ORGANISM="Pyramimonas amylifera, Strain CCMP720" /LENGTH=706 /DNA_ID=CAMNT_0041899009 /DNA_START=60 /DNA_END=2180 /DNA_ORIENTATION=+
MNGVLNISRLFRYSKNGAAFSRFLSSSQTVNAVENITVTVDGVEVQIPKGATVMTACEAAGVDIPRFCYHQRLSIAGNCRMCLVEVEKAPKPVASCAMPAMPNMVVKTTTPLVKKAREGVMEFLLANHPLDCPICDQGGECDLQDQAMAFGSDRGRFVEMKRGVEDKELGPLVKTVMTRCIHCTRCVRFAKEVAGVEDLGTTGRGRDTEIGTYVSKLFKSELSGNVIDLCPVGALTSKPYAFTARTWELKLTESVDVSDALGSAIRIDTKGTEVMRVTPRLHEEVNEEWISDKARFQYDGLKRQRLDAPYLKDGGSLGPATWEQAFKAIKDKLATVKGSEVKAVAGKLADAEGLVAMKDLLNRLGSDNHMCEDFATLDADLRSSYLLNSTIQGVEDADAVLLVGSNPRIEAPVLNSRLRRTHISGGAPVANIGSPLDLTYPVQELGMGAATLDDLLAGKGPFAKTLQEASRPMILVGAGVVARDDRDVLLKKLHTLADKVGVVTPEWNGFNLLHDSAGRVAGLDLGFLPSEAAKAVPAKVVFLLNADDFAAKDVPSDAFVVYLGSHGDKGAHLADVILPSAAYTEKSGTYVNTEGRAQRTNAAVNPPGKARSDWMIIRALSEVLDVTLPYDSLTSVRARMAEIAPHFAFVDQVQPSMWLNGDTYAHKNFVAPTVDAPFSSSVGNFYQTDVVSRNSVTMARSTSAFQ